MGEHSGPDDPSQRDQYLKSLTLYAFGQRKKIRWETGSKEEAQEHLFSLL